MRSSMLAVGLSCGLCLAAAAAAAETPAGGAAGAATAAAPAVEQPAAPAARSGSQPEAKPDAPAARQEAASRDAARAAARPEIALGPVVKDDAGREGRLHVVQTGDTLWDVSDAYLGTPWVWPSIWRENPGVRNPHRIYPGDKLFVSATEMRRISDEEAARMLAGQGDAPAALADGMEGGAAAARTYRFASIETAGFVSVEELNGAASIVDSAVDRVWLSDHDRVMIGLGEGETEIGREYQIFRTTNTVHDPGTGVPVGHATLALGWLVVEEVHPDTSVAKIRVSRGEIRRGDRLLPRERGTSEIPVRSRPDVQGRVVYTWADRLWIGGDDVVYLNRGAAHGLEVGSPLEVYRPIGTGIDAAQERERRLPDVVVAKLLVVDTTAETATAVVTHAGEEIKKGDWFRGTDEIAR